MFQIRTSERTALKRCPQKWYWAIVDGLVPLRPANPLWFGAAVHVALAAWYLPGLDRGPHPAETFDEALKGDRSFLVTTEEEEKEYADARELGIDMLERYIEQYGDDETWDVIATEQQFQVWLPHPVHRSLRRWVRYVGTFDGVYRDLVTGEVFLMEHKTTAGIDPAYLNLDDQAGAYWAVANHKLRRAGVLGPEESIAGIQYNFLRKALRDTRPRDAEGLYHNKPQKIHYTDALNAVILERGINMSLTGREKIEELEELAQAAGITVLGEVSKVQPPAFFERWPVYRDQKERRTMISRIQSEAMYAEAWRAGKFETHPLFKTPIAFGPQACRWSCPFHRMCELHEQGDAGWEEFRDTMFEQTDPYAAHERKSTE